MTGTISYQGKPLGNGRVMFVSQKDPSKLGTSNIESDGSYTVVGMPVGPATITVETYPPTDQGKVASRMKGANPVKLQSHMDMPKPPAGGGTYVKIPDKYKAKETSGLVYDVKPGKQTHDFDLP
ncbi:MAG TPA: hypothetical protein VJ739_07160 [Gemmataceae bacterium]|nr:hypothetical protein [Gemmataceae bacterium]